MKAFSLSQCSGLPPEFHAFSGSAPEALDPTKHEPVDEHALTYMEQETRNSNMNNMNKASKCILSTSDAEKWFLSS